MTRNIGFLLAFGLILFLYGAMNYYIGLRGWQTIGRSFPWLSSKVYWGMIWFTAFSFFLARLTKNVVPVFAERWITYVGAYWMAAFYYLFFIILIIDLVRLADRWSGFLPGGLKANPLIVGWTVIVLVAGLLAYGTWNARNPVVTRYDVTINKEAGDLKQLRIVMASDVHLGLIMDNDRLTHLVNMIRELDPDLVVLPGDIVDESVQPFIEQKMADTFRQLKPPLGVYAVPGNHEHIGDDANDIVRYLKEGGVEVLVNRYVKIGGSFYLAGRDDSGHRRSARKPLADVLDGIDRTKPLILLDHNPDSGSLREARKQGVDLQLSGHTHKGQFFPNNYITEKMYETDWGYLRQGAYQLIVSNGFGTWGPPVRIGNRPEIVEINLHFENAGVLSETVE